MEGVLPKLYSWPAPEGHCFSTQLARTTFEFGAKFGIEETAKGNLIVASRTNPDARFSNRTLQEKTSSPRLTYWSRGKSRAPRCSIDTN